MEDYPSGRRSTSPALLEDRPVQIGQFGVGVEIRLAQHPQGQAIGLERDHLGTPSRALTGFGLVQPRPLWGGAGKPLVGELGQLTSLRLSELSKCPGSAGTRFLVMTCVVGQRGQ